MSFWSHPRGRRWLYSIGLHPILIVYVVFAIMALLPLVQVLRQLLR
jgi:hypothetical protein